MKTIKSLQDLVMPADLLAHDVGETCFRRVALGLNGSKYLDSVLESSGRGQKLILQTRSFQAARALARLRP